MPPVTPIPQSALQNDEDELCLTEVAKFGAVVKIDQKKSLLFDEDATESVDKPK